MNLITLFLPPLLSELVGYFVPLRYKSRKDRPTIAESHTETNVREYSSTKTHKSQLVFTATNKPNIEAAQLIHHSSEKG